MPLLTSLFLKFVSSIVEPNVQATMGANLRTQYYGYCLQSQLKSMGSGEPFKYAQ